MNRYDVLEKLNNYSVELEEEIANCPDAESRYLFDKLHKLLTKERGDLREIYRLEDPRFVAQERLVNTLDMTPNAAKEVVDSLSDLLQPAKEIDPCSLEQEDSDYW